MKPVICGTRLTQTPGPSQMLNSPTAESVITIGVARSGLVRVILTVGPLPIIGPGVRRAKYRQTAVTSINLEMPGSSSVLSTTTEASLRFRCRELEAISWGFHNMYQLWVAL